MPGRVVGNVNQRKDVTTQNQSAAAVSVFDKNVGMRDFLQVIIAIRACRWRVVVYRLRMDMTLDICDERFSDDDSLLF